MNENFNSTQRREDAKTLFEEAGEVFVEGAGHVSAQTPAKCFGSRDGAEKVPSCSARTDCIALDFKNSRQNVLNEFGCRNALAVHIVVCPDKKEVTGVALEKNCIKSRVWPCTDFPTLLRVVNDAFDGFLHGAIRMEILHD